jgi:hypothetical protein
VFVFVLAASVLTGVLFGLAPALRHSRVSQMALLRDVTAASHALTWRRGQRTQGTLIVAEIASETFPRAACLWRSTDE